MIFENLQTLKERIGEVTHRKASNRLRIFEDTTQFMSIDQGDVLRLGNNDYLVTAHAREGRFGIDEQPKFWVKVVRDLTSGKRKIIKLVFRETFHGSIGNTQFNCIRSPEKEADVLEKVRHHPNFMQGESVQDVRGNVVRILDLVSGPSLYEFLRRLKISHEEYYREMFPQAMQSMIQAMEGIALLHSHGMHHGDIRADHLIIESDTGNYVWIDFDYDMGNTIYDVYCLGNVLQQVVGKGRHSMADICDQPQDYPFFKGPLNPGDMLLMYRHRVINLRKLFPYIPGELNEILMRFSLEAADPYQSADSLIRDLRVLFPCQSM